MSLGTLDLTSPHATPPTDRGRLGLVAVGVLAAAPTLLGLSTAGFIADDWILLAQSQSSATSWEQGIDVRFRPIQAAYHGLTFDLLGARPVLHLLVVAALQAVAAVLVILVARRLVSPSTALVVGCVWALLPNRGSTRLWISAAPVTIGVILLLLGALAALGARRRPWLATLCCCAAVLTYEAGAVIGLLIVLWAWRDRDDDARQWLLRATRGLVPYLAVVTWNVAMSPKSSTGTLGRPLAVPDALLGHGLTPRSLGPLAVAAVLTALGAGLALGWNGVRRVEVRRLTLLGLLVGVAGSLPFALAGFDQVNQGPGDRANAHAGLGVALLATAALLGLWTHRRPISALLATTSVALVVLANADDLADVGDAARDGTRVVAALPHLSPELQSRALVLSPMPSHGDWIPFGYGSLQSAATTRGFPGLRIRAPRYELGTVGAHEVVVGLVGDRLAADSALG